MVAAPCGEEAFTEITLILILLAIPAILTILYVCLRLQQIFQNSVAGFDVRVNLMAVAKRPSLIFAV